MNHLLTLNPENVTQAIVNTYRTREAVRAVVMDDQQNIALLHVTNEGYYKLPGGGIDEGESQEVALQRECLEEIGCNVEVLGELGLIVEWRKYCSLKQTSYCYFARVKGEKGVPDFTQKELDLGFEQVWVPYEEALELITQNQAGSMEGREYIVARDTFFLKEAASTFSS